MPAIPHATPSGQHHPSTTAGHPSDSFLSCRSILLQGRHGRPCHASGWGMFTFRTRHAGLGLIEILVAVSLVSIVLVASLRVISQLQRLSLEAEKASLEARRDLAAIDGLIRTSSDNTSFSAASTPFWPVDDPLTTDNESRLALLAIRSGTAILADTGQLRCPIDSIAEATATLTLASSCVAATGLTAATLASRLGNAPLPVVLPIGAQMPCRITSAAAATLVSGTGLALIVANPACLRRQPLLSGGASWLQSGDGVILPWLMLQAVNQGGSETLPLMDNPGLEPTAASLAFMLETEAMLGDGITTSQTSLPADRPTDNLATNWVAVAGFAGQQPLQLFNPRQLDRFSLSIRRLDNRTQLALSGNLGAVFTQRRFDNMTAAGLAATLSGLRVRHPDNATTLSFSLGGTGPSDGGQLNMIRHLQLRNIPLP